MEQKLIDSKKNWQIMDWAELREYRALFWFMVLRDIKILYKQTVLGFAWVVIKPVFSMIVFTIVFGKLAKVPSDGIPYPVFYYAALLPWTYFSSTMNKSAISLITNTSMLTKVYIPRLVLPLTPVLAGLVDFLISFCILGVLMIWYNSVPTLNIVFIPVLMLLMIIATSGIGIWLSALAVQYRDVRHAVQFLIQLLMFAAPVVWPVSLVPEKYRLFYGLYPMAGVIEGFRSALLGAKPMPWDLIFVGIISAVLIASCGIFYFQKVEKTFADLA